MRGIEWSRLISIAIITSLLTCGILAPLWAVALFLIKVLEKPYIPKPRPEPIVILPNNDFAGDWEYRIYEIERN